MAAGRFALGVGKIKIAQLCASVQDMFVSPARLIVRRPGKWYVPSGLWGGAKGAVPQPAVASA